MLAGGYSAPHFSWESENSRMPNIKGTMPGGNGGGLGQDSTYSEINHSIVMMKQRCKKRYFSFLSSLMSLWLYYFLILVSVCRNHFLITPSLEHVSSERSQDINVCHALQWKFLRWLISPISWLSCSKSSYNVLCYRKY
jgi:uncharacterized membrane protein (DUF485 family)